MSHTTEHTSIGNALFHYDLFPEKIEHYGKVKKIYSSRGVFALKEFLGTREDAKWFIHCYDRLLSLKYSHIVPIYKTKFGDPLARVGNSYFYLMQWYNDEEQDIHGKQEFFIKELGEIHGLTVKEQVYSSEVTHSSYDALIRRFEARQQQMEHYAEISERNTYISPFELNYLSHFRRLMKMADEAKKHAGAWFELSEANNRYRSVLCHGRPLPSHALINDRGDKLIINLERAVLDSPVRDLAIFYRAASNYGDWNVQEGLEWLEIYEQRLELLPEEKRLLASYLYFPESMFILFDQYWNNKREFSHIDYVRRFEVRLRSMRRLCNFADKIIDTI